MYRKSRSFKCTDCDWSAPEPRTEEDAARIAWHAFKHKHVVTMEVTLAQKITPEEARKVFFA